MASRGLGRSCRSQHDRNPEGLDVEALDRPDTILVFASIAPAQMTRPASGLTFRLEAPPGYDQQVRKTIGVLLSFGGNVVSVDLNAEPTPDTTFLIYDASLAAAEPTDNADLRNDHGRDPRRPRSAASTRRSRLGTDVPRRGRSVGARRDVVDIDADVGRCTDGDHRMSQATAAALAVTAARTADDKKAERTLVLFVGDVLSITDYFVITSASNRRLVRMVVDEIETAVREQHGRSPLRVEGVAEQQWVLIDYGDAVIHVFSDEIRAVLRDRAAVPRRAQDRLAGRRGPTSRSSSRRVASVESAMSLPLSGPFDTGQLPRLAAHPVTVTVARTIAPGWEAEFLRWADELVAAAREFPGCLGAAVLHPGADGGEYQIIVRFSDGI